MSRTGNRLLFSMALAIGAAFFGNQAMAANDAAPKIKVEDQIAKKFKKVTPSERKAAAERFKAAYATKGKKRDSGKDHYEPEASNNQTTSDHNR